MKIKLSKKTKSFLETLAYIFIGYLIAVGANKGMSMAMHTDYPVVAVVSSSMEHDDPISYETWFIDRKYDEADREEWDFGRGINKGDIVFVNGVPLEEIGSGDVIVYKSGNMEPIIHRVIEVTDDGLRAKGDNNIDVDQEDSIPIVTQGALQGRAVFRVPMLGYVKIAFMKITGRS